VSRGGSACTSIRMRAVPATGMDPTSSQAANQRQSRRPRSTSNFCLDGRLLYTPDVILRRLGVLTLGVALFRGWFRLPRIFGSVGNRTRR
jgi:hypothetical protein